MADSERVSMLYLYRRFEKRISKGELHSESCQFSNADSALIGANGKILIAFLK